MIPPPPPHPTLCPALLSSAPRYLHHFLLSLFFLLCSFHSPFHPASFDPSISLYKSIHISTLQSANTMDSCGDDKWKLSKKGRSRSGRCSSSSYYSSDGAAAASSSSSAVQLSRSYSASVSATRDVVANTTSTTASSSSQQPEQPSSSRLSKKCVEAVKEQRARFYIVRRCVSMLVCWRDY